MSSIFFFCIVFVYEHPMYPMYQNVGFIQRLSALLRLKISKRLNLDISSYAYSAYHFRHLSPFRQITPSDAKKFLTNILVIMMLPCEIWRTFAPFSKVFSIIKFYTQKFMLHLTWLFFDIFIRFYFFK